jgi:hypothetical protein
MLDKLFDSLSDLEYTVGTWCLHSGTHHVSPFL